MDYDKLYEFIKILFSTMTEFTIDNYPDYVSLYVYSKYGIEDTVSKFISDIGLSLDCSFQEFDLYKSADESLILHLSK